MLVAGESLSRKGERPVSTKVARPGGFLPRLIALIIDSLVLLVILFPVMALWTLQLTPAKLENGAPPSGLDAVRGSLSLQVTLVVLYLFYGAGSWTIMGATPGQLLMSLRVTDQNAAGIGFFRAVVRYLLYVLLSPLAVVSALMVGVSKNKRALHDLLAGTYVIQVVDRDDLLADATGLPAAFGGGQRSDAVSPVAAAPAPAPAPVPVEPPAAAATYPAPPAAPTYAPAPPAAGYSPPPAVAAPAPAPAAALPPLDFPAMPMMGTAADVPPPPGHQAPAGGMDDGLYAPPTMVDPTTPLGEFNAPTPAAPADREIYTPQPGAFDPRTARSTEQFAAPPDFSAPPPPPPPGAVAPAPPPPLQPEGDLPPFEFPPMAPPPEPNK